MELTLLVIATFLLSAAAGWLTIPRIVMISKKKKLFDELSARKSHTGAVPRLGGVSFLPAFLFSFSLAVGLRYMLGLDVAAPHEMAIPREFMFLVSGATVLFCVGLADDLAGVGYRIKFLAQLLFCVGLADDLAGVGYRIKFLAQLLSAALLLCSGVWIDNLDGLFGLHHVPTAVGALLTVLVVVLLTNAYNLIDGIDGLCSGLSILALFTFGVWFLTHHIYVYAMMSMAMGGVVTIFFFYNVMGRRMKIFMGDTGSLLLGFVIAFLGLKFYDLNINGEFYRIDAAPAVFLGIVFIPAFDTVRVFCVRMAAGLSPFYPDRRHIHHKLLRIGLTHLQGTLVIVVLQACFILLNFLLRNVNINLLFGINLVLGVLLIQGLNALGGRIDVSSQHIAQNRVQNNSEK